MKNVLAVAAVVMLLTTVNMAITWANKKKEIVGLTPEQVTVIEGTRYLGEGEKFDSAKLKGYPAGSFIIIPAGIPHFVATEGTVLVQLSGTGKPRADYLEK